MRFRAVPLPIRSEVRAVSGEERLEGLASFGQRGAQPCGRLDPRGGGIAQRLANPFP